MQLTIYLKIKIGNIEINPGYPYPFLIISKDNWSNTTDVGNPLKNSNI